MSSSTFDNDESMMTTRAASEVTSLCWPNAMPTVAAISAGASLMPSPMNTVFACAVSRRTIATFSSGDVLGVDLA